MLYFEQYETLHFVHTRASYSLRNPTGCIKVHLYVITTICIPLWYLASSRMLQLRWIAPWHTAVRLHVVSDHAYDCEWTFRSTFPLFPLWIPSWYKPHIVTVLAPWSVFVECTMNCICAADSWWCRICTFETASTLDVKTDSVSVLLQSYQPFCHTA